jgi:multiple sugar transport system substrate-binding protein
VVRPATPSYSDVTLAIQSSLHPPAKIDPQKSINTLKDRLNILADGGMY